MIEFLRRLKRALVAWRKRAKVRSEAARAFRYDERQFMQNAGALHLDRKAAARAEIVMGYHVLEKGLTMPRRRLGFGKGAVVHLVNLVDSFERRFGKDDRQVRHAVGVLRAYRELHRESPDPMPRLDAFLATPPDVPAADEPHVSRSDFFAAKAAPFPQFAASRHDCRHFAGPVPEVTIKSAVELALTAPSACNRQHARVHVVDDPALR
ncbi:MAG: nitroreductase family protein, partial [Kiritimatiellae bacterium]|nr:nitroreductase family protein [Kiritimatiellia bacterium]